MMSRKTVIAAGALIALGLLGWLGLRHEAVRARPAPPAVATGATAPHAAPPRAHPLARPELPIHGAIRQRPPEPTTEAAYIAWVEQYDPVTRLVPMLAHRTPEEQHLALSWMLRAPEDKLVSAFPSVAGNPEVPVEDRLETARQLAHALLATLEAEGYRSAPLPSDLQVATVVRIDDAR